MTTTLKTNSSKMILYRLIYSNAYEHCNVLGRAVQEDSAHKYYHSLIFLCIFPRFKNISRFLCTGTAPPVSQYLAFHDTLLQPSI